MENKCEQCAFFTKDGECTDIEFHDGGAWVLRQAERRRSQQTDICGPDGFRWKRQSLWQRLRNFLTPSNAGGDATERSEGRVDHNVGRRMPGKY